MQIEVNRGGVSLGVLRDELHYDFKHQSLEQSRVPILMPGDSLRLTCEYDTTDVSNPTIFGESTQNEMCWSAFMFYPAVPFAAATTQILPSAGSLTSLSTACSTQSQNISVFITQVSQCTQLWYYDPIYFGFQFATGANAAYICNVFPVSFPAEFASIISQWPNLCPPCVYSQNCSETVLEEWGQTVVCVEFCNAFALSVWPDTTNTVAVLPTSLTACDINRLVPSAWVPLPTCVPVGNLATMDTSQTVSAVNAIQPACPIQAIQSMLTNCTSSDFHIGSNGFNDCRSQCRTWAAALTTTFSAMTPVPSGTQAYDCILNAYNTTCNLPPWSDFSGIQTRLQTTGLGFGLCDSPTSPASHVAPWSLFGGLLFTAVACL